MIGERISVFGGGSWGTALVKILSDSGNEVTWWVRSQNDVDYIKKHHHNPKYLSAASINMDLISITSDIQHGIDVGDVLVWVIPSAFIHEALSKASLPSEKYYVSAIKGVVPEHKMIIGDYFNQIHQISKDHIGVITGPCHAEEVAMERLSYLTSASENSELAIRVAERLSCEYISVTTSDDIFGTEYAAVLKNVYAIAAGISHSLGRGDNFQSVLMSNAIREIKRFIEAVHPIDRDIDDSAYLGDLLVTGYSQFSRNRTFGAMLGKGYTVRSAIMEMNMIAEGYYATESIYRINEGYGVNMPILQFVYDVIYNEKKAVNEIKALEKQLD